MSILKVGLHTSILFQQTKIDFFFIGFLKVIESKIIITIGYNVKSVFKFCQNKSNTMQNHYIK